jgi:hypothetical protein
VRALGTRTPLVVHREERQTESNGNAEGNQQSGESNVSMA